MLSEGSLPPHPRVSPPVRYCRKPTPLLPLPTFLRASASQTEAQAETMTSQQCLHSQMSLSSGPHCTPSPHVSSDPHMARGLEEPCLPASWSPLQTRGPGRRRQPWQARTKLLFLLPPPIPSCRRTAWESSGGGVANSAVGGGAATTGSKLSALRD